MNKKSLSKQLIQALVSALMFFFGPVSGWAERSAAAFHPLEPIRWTLPDGLTVLLLEDPELPLVSGTLYMRGGGWWEPAGKLGVVDAMGDELRLGGAGERSAESVDEELDRLAASIQSSFGLEYGTVSFECLSTDLPRVFNMFADVLREPRFEEERLELWKGQQIEGIRRRTDDPGTIAELAFSELVFGSAPPGRVAVEDDIRSITRSDLLDAYEAFVRPDEAILAVSGNLSRAALEELVAKRLSDWPSRGKTLEAPVLPDYTLSPGIYFLEFPFEQAAIFMGQQGPERNTPDWPAIRGFNEAFGSAGFTSRIVRRIREQLGLAYVAYGAVVGDFVVGRNLIFIQTKNQSVGDAIVESFAVLQDLQKRNISAEELSRTKRSIENSFVFKYDTVGKQINRAATLRILGYPPDFDDTYVPKIAALEPAEIRAVAIKRWDLSKFVIVVVGDENAYNSLVKLASYNGSRMPARYELHRLAFNQKLVVDGKR